METTFFTPASPPPNGVTHCIGFIRLQCLNFIQNLTIFSLSWSWSRFLKTLYSPSISPSSISPSSPLLLGCNCRWLRYAGLIFKRITVYHPHIHHPHHHHPYLIFVTMMMMIINVTIIIIDYINLILSGKQGWDRRM